jgi:ribonuclease III
MSYHELMTTIGYHFKNSQLLELALTHRSAEANHNERLEFIGDGLVNLIIGEALYLAHPLAPEGELSRWRAALVQRETLADIAKNWQLEHFIMLGPGERKTGGEKRPSILANSVEAIFGAIYFDSDFETTKTVILKTYDKRLKSPQIAAIEKDAKTMLQEFLQAKQQPLPEYILVEVSGKEHERVFKIECCHTNLRKSAFGTGPSKRKAEQEAAKALYFQLNPPKS